jgi:hypothetical protein
MKSTNIIKINDDVTYDKEKNLYYYDGKVFDERSALHNGIFGLGAKLRDMIKSENSRITESKK